MTPLHDKYTQEYNKKEQYQDLMSSIDARNLYEQMKKETVPCNLCGTTDLVDVVSCDRYGMGLCTVMCKNCGFLFTNPRPIEAEMNRFYRESYRDFYFNAPDPSKNDYLISEVRNTAVKRANWLFDFVEEELDALSISLATVLDAGCGDGSFLNIVRSKIPDSKLFGIEPSQLYARFAVQKSMADVYTGDIVSFFNERKSQDCLFNLIVLSHVLEHLYNPLEKLLMLRELLASEGLFCVEVPNLLSPYWQGNGMFHIAHINHFTPATIRFIFAKAGFNCIKEFFGKHPVDPWAMTYIFKKTDETPVISFPSMTDEESTRLLVLIQDRVYRKNNSTEHRRTDKKSFIRNVTYRNILSVLKAKIRQVLGYDVTEGSGQKEKF